MIVRLYILHLYMKNAKAQLKNSKKLCTLVFLCNQESIVLEEYYMCEEWLYLYSKCLNVCMQLIE